MKDDLLRLYTSFLELCNLEVDREGYISVVLGENKRPALIEGKRLVMPTDTQLQMPDWESRIGFHPIRESLNRGISPVLNNCRKMINARLNSTALILMKFLIEKSGSVGEQKHFSPDQSVIFSLLKSVNEKTVKEFNKLVQKMKVDSDEHQIIRIYLKRSGVIGSATFGRVGVVAFPLYEELMKDGDTVWGVKIAPKDRETFKAVHRYLFPKIDHPDAYHIGTNSRQGPFLEVLIRSSLSIISDLSNQIELYKDKLDLYDIIKFPDGLDEWESAFDDKKRLDILWRVIPVLSGNEGSISKVEEEQKKNAIDVNAVAPVLQQPVATPPVQTQTHTATPVHTNPPPKAAPQAPAAPTERRRMGQPMDTNNPPSASPTVVNHGHQPHPLHTPQGYNAPQPMQPQYPGMAYPNGMMPAQYPGMMPGMMPQPMQQQPMQLPPGMMVYPNGQIGPTTGMMPGMVPSNMMPGMMQPGMMPGQQPPQTKPGEAVPLRQLAMMNPGMANMYYNAAQPQVGMMQPGMMQSYGNQMGQGRAVAQPLMMYGYPNSGHYTV